MNIKSIQFGKIAFLVILLQLFAASCYKANRESFTPGVPDISFPQTAVTVPSETDTIEIPVTANLPWRVKAAADWITFVKANGDKTGTFRVAIARNRTTEPRTAEITGYITADKAVKMTITQQGGEPAPDHTRHFYVKANGDENKDGLSWENATTLDAALANAANGDEIHIAGGTYHPSKTITGGNAGDASDNTFEIAQNVHLTGGYPADARTGSVADPARFPVLLSGGDKNYHVVVVSAIPEGEHTVSMQGITITKGHAGSSGAVAVNGASLARNYGGGLVVIKSKLLLEDCRITDNSSDQHIAGIYMLSQSEVTIRNSSVSDNKATGNGGGIWNDGSKLYVFDSEITGNSATGVGGGLYSLNVGVVSYNYLYNVTIAENQVGAPGFARVGAGIYSRERSQYQIVNCTIYGNKNVGSGFGAGVAVYGGSTVDIINTTISNNEGGVGNTAANGGSGVFNNNSPTANTVNIYNSVVSGNTGHTNEIGGANISLQSSIVGTGVYNYAKTPEPGQSFDPATMFQPFAAYGTGYGKTLPVKAGTPATVFGMTTLQLQVAGANLSLDENYYLKDQNNKSRTGTTVMGAVLP
ncbi:right-handed parallel beta-helix repeat-containing protein [Niabella beijingensis]|uniref:right-handed parallel beta-helix repeat-containing protein n=1 Tax=Niabella beijingensis TaxID=2872700 RepID=UPI001CC0AF11|nr:right-handed parallel beta-helix repeat-containing protein [Niabella beijingensis]MBZ4189882.1 right-handed parallel beta-helix repeat-containing protein [Niabella beijingensis]